MTVAVTAYCNLRCIGRRCGRDFMPGHQLSLETVRTLLDDARPAAIETVRLYGGEPLLHPALPQMVRHAVDLGLSSYVTTKGLLLKQKIRLLYDAGLRNITIACKRPRGTATGMCNGTIAFVVWKRVLQPCANSMDLRYPCSSITF